MTYIKYEVSNKIMKTEILVQKYESFRPEIQREILDFIEYLELKYKVSSKTRKKLRKPIEKEAFVGMWSKRKEMQEPIKYIKNLRKKHWKRY